LTVERTDIPAYYSVVDSLILTLAGWAACFWLGFQIGASRSELRRKADVDELERRYKIVDCKVVGGAGAQRVDARI
jgi:hypothetical protein